MKRTITALLVACVLLFSSISVASAAIFGSVAPMAENYLDAEARLKIVSGTATVSGNMNGKMGITTKVTIHLYLQQYKNGKWTDYDDWLESKNGTGLTVSKTVTVPTGYKYRAKASCYAYAGNNCEHAVKYSGEVQ